VIEMKMHVVARPRGWAVVHDQEQISRTYRDKKSAIKWAQKNGEVVIHAKSGRIQKYAKQATKSKVPNQHVIPKGKSWAVKCERCLKNTEVFNNRTDAIVRAEQIAGNYGSNVVIHKDDGRIEHHTKPKFREFKGGILWNIFRKEHSNL